MKKSMPRKRGLKPKLTDAERHKRFVDMAHEVGASDDPRLRGGIQRDIGLPT